MSGRRIYLFRYLRATTGSWRGNHQDLSIEICARNGYGGASGHPIPKMATVSLDVGLCLRLLSQEALEKVSLLHKWPASSLSYV